MWYDILIGMWISLVEHSLWERAIRRFESCHPDFINIKKMKNYPIYPVAEFENRFDEMFERVEHGETIGILNTDGNVVVMTPLEEPIQKFIKNENKE